jgi:hypothetical protein
MREGSRSTGCAISSRVAVTKSSRLIKVWGRFKTTLLVYRTRPAGAEERPLGRTNERGSL